MRNARKRRLKRAQRKPAAKRDAIVGKMMAKKKKVTIQRRRLEVVDDPGLLVIKPKRRPGRPKKEVTA